MNWNILAAFILGCGFSSLFWAFAFMRQQERIREQGRWLYKLMEKLDAMCKEDQGR
jgi:hypothetical protein